MLYFSAISERVSPDLTVYVTVSCAEARAGAKKASKAATPAIVVLIFLVVNYISKNSPSIEYIYDTF